MLLDVRNLKVKYKDRKNKVQIIKDISFTLEENKCLGILGESGSGKSITTKAIMRLLDPRFKIEGNVIFKGTDILRLKEKAVEKIRGKDICMIIQNPMTAFNPVFTIGNQMMETLRAHLTISKNEAKKLSLEALKKMNLSDESILKKYPHELSGGMLQRIMIGLTIVLEPDLIIADEPTTAIDAVNQLEVIEELKKLRIILNTSMIFITHDLGVLAELADDVIVMDTGEIIESGTLREVINAPKNHHTKYLIDTRLKLFKSFNRVIEEGVS